MKINSGIYQDTGDEAIYSVLAQVCDTYFDDMNTCTCTYMYFVSTGAGSST